MEGSHLDKIVGVPKEHMADAEEYTRQVAKQFGAEKIDNEIEKTEHDIELLDFAQSSVDEYLGQYGREKTIVLPLERIHLLEEGGTEINNDKAGIGSGSHSTYESSVEIDRFVSDTKFVSVAFHELVHAKSYQALQAASTRHKESGQPFIVPYRSGFSVVSRDGEKIYFRDWEEAVVSFLERRFYEEKVKNNPLFKDEEEMTFTRQEEFDDLNKLVDELWEKNRDSYDDREEILRLFIEAGVTGKLLKVARLIEKTFGKGSFRELAEKDVREIELKGKE